MSEGCRELWQGLAEGIYIPEYDVLVPWGIGREAFHRLLPAEAIDRSSQGCWPLVRFTLFGFHALFGFNFVSEPQGQMSEVQFYNTHPRKLKRSFRQCVSQLTPRLGRPNLVDCSWGQQYWRVDKVSVENFISRTLRGFGQKPRTYHMLSVRYEGGVHAS